MKSARVFGIALSLLFAAWPGAHSRAAVVYFNAASGFWDVGSNWSTGNVPSSSDRAVIVSGHTCTVRNNASIDTIAVQSTGTLNVNSGITLTLYNLVDNLGTGGANDSFIDGDVVVAGSSGGGGALLFLDASHAISGAGKIVLGKLADIQIEDGVTVYNQLATSGKGIRGQGGRIRGDGSDDITRPNFENQGLVAADTGDGPQMRLMSDVVVTDTSAAHWSLEATDTVMQFDRAATSLVGAFDGHCNAYFYMNLVEIRTCGQFTRNGCGVWPIQNGGLFRFQTYSAGSNPTGCSTYTPSSGSTPGCNGNYLYELSSILYSCSCP